MGGGGATGVATPDPAANGQITTQRTIKMVNILSPFELGGF